MCEDKKNDKKSRFSFPSLRQTGGKGTLCGRFSIGHFSQAEVGSAGSRCMHQMGNYLCAALAMSSSFLSIAVWIPSHKTWPSIHRNSPHSLTRSLHFTFPLSLSLSLSLSRSLLVTCYALALRSPKHRFPQARRGSSRESFGARANKKGSKPREILHWPSVCWMLSNLAASTCIAASGLLGSGSRLQLLWKGNRSCCAPLKARTRDSIDGAV